MLTLPFSVTDSNTLCDRDKENEETLYEYVIRMK